MTILSELQACNHNPIGGFSRDTVELYWQNHTTLELRRDLINLWLNQ